MLAKCGGTNLVSRAEVKKINLAAFVDASIGRKRGVSVLLSFVSEAANRSEFSGGLTNMATINEQFCSY